MCVGCKWVLSGRRGQELLYHLLSKSEIQDSAFRIKIPKPFSFMSPSWALPCTIAPMQQQCMNSHRRQHGSSPMASVPRGPPLWWEQSRPSSISMSPWQPFFPLFGYHVKEMLPPPLGFNVSLVDAREVSQPQLQGLESISPHISLLKLLSV